MARKFFLVAAGMLMLTLAFHLGYSTATAQAPSNPVVAAIGFPGQVAVVTANGDVYVPSGMFAPNNWSRVQNVFGGAPTPALQESWGQVKGRYR